MVKLKRQCSNRLVCTALAAALISCVSSLAADEAGRTLAEFQPELTDEMTALLKQANPEKGEVLFMRKCSSCHDHKQSGGHGKGPHIWNVVGRKAGSEADFVYSDAMKASGHTWSITNLNYYLTRTDVAVPGLAMNFRGIKKDKKRADLLSFLMTLSDQPLDHKK